MAGTNLFDVISLVLMWVLPFLVIPWGAQHIFPVLGIWQKDANNKLADAVRKSNVEATAKAVEWMEDSGFDKSTIQQRTIAGFSIEKDVSSSFSGNVSKEDVDLLKSFVEIIKSTKDNDNHLIPTTTEPNNPPLSENDNGDISSYLKNRG